ncbi:MAG TPA: hypothetical protein VLX91_06925 [Candidatus Acidoferrales bacterium]|nr:hypothetical protein [Candidatus Acidoferrales bacterium]
MKTKRSIFALIMLLSFSTAAFCQSDDLRIFGYFQNNFMHETVDISYPQSPVPSLFQSFKPNSFLMQQMNVFLQKDFGTQVSSFVNLQFTNSFSSSDDIGALNIEEAWLKYSPSEELSVKFGLLVPRFNNFNEIKDRTVLLPYIFRPIAYETAFSNLFNTQDFVPLQAYLQIYGYLPISGGLRVNYAAFMGNLSTDNLVKNNGSFGQIGNDTTKFKMFGGRFGVDCGNLSLGVSGTYDRANLWAYGIGYVPRTRFGAYLNYSVAGFELEGEYIKVHHILSDANKATLLAEFMAELAQLPTNPTILLTPQSFEKKYEHINLLYNFTDKIFAYTGYDFLTTDDQELSMGGVHVVTVGGGYKFGDDIVVKAQYLNCKSKISNAIPVTTNAYLLATSVYF